MEKKKVYFVCPDMDYEGEEDFDDEEYAFLLEKPEKLRNGKL